MPITTAPAPARRIFFNEFIFEEDDEDEEEDEYEDEDGGVVEYSKFVNGDNLLQLVKGDLWAFNLFTVFKLETLDGPKRVREDGDNPRRKEVTSFRALNIIKN